MSTAFELIQQDKRLQEHWLRRLVAIIIDVIIIGIFMGIISFIIGFGVYWFGFSLKSLLWSSVSGVIFFLYSAFFEGFRGATIGKMLLKLEVVSVSRAGPMDITKALMRNLSKIHGVLLLLDVIIAFLTDGEPKQRYLDRIANTTAEDISGAEGYLHDRRPPRGPPRPYRNKY